MRSSPEIMHQSADATQTAPPVRLVLLRIVALVVAIRVGLQIIGMAAAVVAGESVQPLRLWVAWDAMWYLRIAEQGYPQHGEAALDIVFFPLFPLLVRLVALVVREPVVAGLLVATVASVVAALLLYLVVRLDAPHAEAWRAVLILFAFPTAFFMAAPYTEAMFLSAVLGAVYAARSGRWPWSLAGSVAATATRVTGLAVLPALAVEALLQPGTWRDRAQRLALAGLAAGGFAVYLALNLAVHGDPFTFMRFQRQNWHNELTWPWRPLAESVRVIAAGDMGIDQTIIYWGRLAGAAVGVGLLAAGWRRLRPADTVYGWVALVGVLSSTWLISLPRYLLTIYPLLVVLAWLSRSRIVLWTIVAAGASAQILFFSRYALGWWTF